MQIERSWSTIVTVCCLIVVAIIEAWQQAAAGAINVYPHLDGVWRFVPIILLVVAGISWLAGHSHGGGKKQQGQSLASSALASAVPSPMTSPIDINKFFHVAYSGQLQTETEGNIRAMIHSQAPDEREQFIVRFIATGLINAIYDHIWLTLYRSQLLVLAELNKSLLRREQIKVYYDEAVRKSPEFYEEYSFDQWLDYLRSQLLLLEHPGQTFEITVRGKDFLKYMVHNGYNADSRKY